MLIKSWVPYICNGNVISNFPIMQVMAKTTNVENVDAQELKEQERCSKILLFMELWKRFKTPTFLGNAIDEFLTTHYGMAKVNVKAHKVGKQCTSHSRGTNCMLHRGQ